MEGRTETISHADAGVLDLRRW